MEIKIQSSQTQFTQSQFTQVIFLFVLPTEQFPTWATVLLVLLGIGLVAGGGLAVYLWHYFTTGVLCECVFQILFLVSIFILLFSSLNSWNHTLLWLVCAAVFLFLSHFMFLRANISNSEIPHEYAESLPSFTPVTVNNAKHKKLFRTKHYEITELKL